jgi:hypothetical protein
MTLWKTQRRFLTGMGAGVLAGMAALVLPGLGARDAVFPGITAEEKAAPVLSAGPATFPAGVAAAVPVSLRLPPDPTSVPATAVVVLEPTVPWMEIRDVLPAAGLAAAGKGMSFRLADGAARVAVYGGDAPLPAEVLFHIVTRLDADTPSGASGGYSELPGGSAASVDALPVPLAFEGPGVTIADPGGQHAGDYVADWRVSVSELLRIIQFYNTGSLHCDPSTEDGFAPGPGGGTCPAHSADYAPQDWTIAFSELLRIIQFYNAGCYGPAPNTEDGFAPCPFFSPS